jgi:hypothetical protein
LAKAQSPQSAGFKNGPAHEQLFALALRCETHDLPSLFALRPAALARESELDQLADGFGHGRNRVLSSPPFVDRIQLLLFESYQFFDGIYFRSRHGDLGQMSFAYAVLTNAYIAYIKYAGRREGATSHPALTQAKEHSNGPS